LAEEPKVSKITRKDLEKLKADAEKYRELMGHLEADPDSYARARSLFTDFRVEKEKNVGLKDLIGAVHKYTPHFMDSVYSFVDDVYEHQQGIIGARKFLHRSKIPWGVILVLVGIGVVLYELQNPANSAAFGTWLNSSNALIEMVVVAGAALGVAYYWRRKG
jgi:hypothetical protein